jgi:zinc protease
MLATGTRTKSRAQLSDAFDALQTTWSLDSHPVRGASAGLNTRRANLEPALALLAEVLREPAFPPAEFEQLVRQELGGLERAAAEPSAVASLALSRALNPYPSDDVRHIATLAENRAAIQALKLDDIKAFYQSHWGAEHAELAIVGDFDPARIKPLIAQLLGDWKSAQAYARVPQPASAVTGARLLATLKDKPNATILGALPLKLADTDADYPALALAAHVLGGGGFDSRLLTRLRQQDGLSYGSGANLAASSFEPAGSLSFYAIFAPENRARVEQGLSEELARFVKDGISADELASAKKAILAGASTRRASDSAVARSWAGKLERTRTFAWDADLEAKLAALTQAQVNAAIRKWIEPGHVNWSLAGDFDKAP